ncbi:hypothetical protein MTBLM1_20283 [Rhodospirillaceae bacterium LM-1]|nr:hypothetical protein MTBLM1_20283 [Rhodospirillaceae bacterium LM-1]
MRIRQWAGLVGNFERCRVDDIELPRRLRRADSAGWQINSRLLLDGENYLSFARAAFMPSVCKLMSSGWTAPTGCTLTTMRLASDMVANVWSESCACAMQPTAVHCVIVKGIGAMPSIFNVAPPGMKMPSGKAVTMTGSPCGPSLPIVTWINLGPPAFRVWTCVTIQRSTLATACFSHVTSHFSNCCGFAAEEGSAAITAGAASDRAAVAAIIVIFMLLFPVKVHATGCNLACRCYLRTQSLSDSILESP